MAVSTLDKCSLVLLKHWGSGYAVELKKRKERAEGRKGGEEREDGKESEEKDISLISQTPRSLIFLPKVPFASRKSNPSVYKASFGKRRKRL